MNTVIKEVTAESECQTCKIQETLDIILSEVRAMRREKLPADPAKIEELLATLFIIFNDAEFTSLWILETCTDSDNDAIRLRESVTAVIGTTPKVKRLSRFLGKAIGTYGGYRLEVANPHSRDGATFKISVTK